MISLGDNVGFAFILGWYYPNLEHREPLFYLMEKSVLLRLEFMNSIVIHGFLINRYNFLQKVNFFLFFEKVVVPYSDNCRSTPSIAHEVTMYELSEFIKVVR